jgi:hypothetical protein
VSLRESLTNVSHRVLGLTSAPTITSSSRTAVIGTAMSVVRSICVMASFSWSLER